MPPAKTLLNRWRDCCTNTGTFEEQEARNRNLIIVETVGHLVMEHKDRITLAGEYFEVENTYRHLTTIPRVNIEEVFEMKHGAHKPMMKHPKTMPKGHKKGKKGRR